MFRVLEYKMAHVKVDNFAKQFEAKFREKKRKFSHFLRANEMQKLNEIVAKKNTIFPQLEILQQSRVSVYQLISPHVTENKGRLNTVELYSVSRHALYWRDVFDLRSLLNEKVLKKDCIAGLIYQIEKQTTSWKYQDQWYSKIQVKWLN